MEVRCASVGRGDTVQSVESAFVRSVAMRYSAALPVELVSIGTSTAQSIERVAMLII